MVDLPVVPTYLVNIKPSEKRFVKIGILAKSGVKIKGIATTYLMLKFWCTIHSPVDMVNVIQTSRMPMTSVHPLKVVWDFLQKQNGKSNMARPSIYFKFRMFGGGAASELYVVEIYLGASHDGLDHQPAKHHWDLSQEKLTRILTVAQFILKKTSNKINYKERSTSLLFEQINPENSQATYNSNEIHTVHLLAYHF